MFENPRRGRQARNFTTNVPKILDLKSSSEQIFFRKLSLGAPECSCLLDLKKAFDTVNHAILLSKLQAYGIRDSANQWFCSYLRKGTTLGPLLFLLYINDLPNCLVHSQPRMYADDTSITYARNVVEEIERCVNIDLDRTNLH